MMRYVHALARGLHPLQDRTGPWPELLGRMDPTGAL